MGVNGRLRELEEECDDLRAEITHLNQGNKVLEARIVELEKENRRLKKRISESEVDELWAVVTDA